MAGPVARSPIDQRGSTPGSPASMAAPHGGRRIGGRVPRLGGCRDRGRLWLPAAGPYPAWRPLFDAGMWRVISPVSLRAQCSRVDSRKYSYICLSLRLFYYFSVTLSCGISAEAAKLVDDIRVEASGALAATGGGDWAFPAGAGSAMLAPARVTR